MILLVHQFEVQRAFASTLGIREGDASIQEQDRKTSEVEGVVLPGAF